MSKNAMHVDCSRQMEKSANQHASCILANLGHLTAKIEINVPYFSQYFSLSHHSRHKNSTLAAGWAGVHGTWWQWRQICLPLRVLPHHVFFLSIIFYAAVQFLFFIAIKSDKKDVKFTDYTPWSKNDTYFETCQQCYIGNCTWGNRLTNLVDKANAKPIVEAMNIKKNPKDLHHDIQQRKHFRFYRVEYEADSSAI